MTSAQATPPKRPAAKLDEGEGSGGKAALQENGKRRRVVADNGHVGATPATLVAWTPPAVAAAEKRAKQKGGSDINGVKDIRGFLIPLRGVIGQFAGGTTSAPTTAARATPAKQPAAQVDEGEGRGKRAAPQEKGKRRRAAGGNNHVGAIVGTGMAGSFLRENGNLSGNLVGWPQIPDRVVLCSPKFRGVAVHLLPTLLL